MTVVNVTDGTLKGRVTGPTFTGDVDGAKFTGSVTYVDNPVPPEPPVENSVSLFTTQTPTKPDVTDPGDYELGMKFTSKTGGNITAIKHWKAASETGTNTGRIWSSSGSMLASVQFTNQTASGWQQQKLASPLAIKAGDTYTVSVNINKYYAVTDNGFAAAISNGGLTAPVSAGVLNERMGSFPSTVFNKSNYFRDVVFAAGAPGPADTVAPTAPTNLKGTAQ